MKSDIQMINKIDIINSFQQAPKTIKQFKTVKDLKAHLKKMIKHGAENLSCIVKLSIDGRPPQMYVVVSYEDNTLRISPMCQAIQSDIKILSYGELSDQMFGCENNNMLFILVFDIANRGSALLVTNHKSVLCSPLTKQEIELVLFGLSPDLVVNS